MRPLAITVVTPPAAEPLSLDDVKEHCRIDTDADDVTLSAYIAAARAVGETETQRAFLEQVFEARYDAWPGAGESLWLPRPPLVDVESVTYIDADGAEQTLSTDVYGVDTAQEPGRVYLKSGQSWPTLGEHPSPIRVEYTAGHEDADEFAAAFPSLILALMQCVADWYRVKENTQPGTQSKVPYAAQTLFGQCAVPWGY